MTMEDPMQCCARWDEDPFDGVGFRDQTLLQFGEDWSLHASLVLRDLGSAVLADPEPQDAYRAAMNLPFLAIGGTAHDDRFTVDAFMRGPRSLQHRTHPGAPDEAHL